MDSTGEVVEERSCGNCVHHSPEASIDNVPSECWACTARSGNPLFKSKEVKIKTTVDTAAADPFTEQVGGDHYKRTAIQPMQYAIANGFDFFQFNVVKYISRIKGDKEKRLEDLRKARDYINKYIHSIETGAWKWN